LILPDSSVVVAALAPWHPAHETAREAIGGAQSRLIAHVAFETASVLSRMPEGRRVAAPLVVEALLAGFPKPWLSLDGDRTRVALQRAVVAGLRGGALYDALIAATAAHHGGQLVSADRRARRTYDALDVDVVYVT
jgi:predicted nucleic acid-binding protein